MKSRYFLAALLAVGVQNVLAAPAVMAEPWHVTARDMNSRVWESLELLTDPATGRVTPHKHSYIEYATGQNFFDPTTGQWEETQEKFEIAPAGHAIAVKGPHQVMLAANINSGASVDILTPDDKRLMSNPIGFSFL